VAAARIYRDYGLEYPLFYATMFSAIDPRRNVRGNKRRSVGRATFDFLVARVQECMDSGSFQGSSAFDSAVRVWATSHGFVSLQTSGRLGLDRDEFNASTMLQRAAIRRQ
jgi:hypothetical protein